MSLKDLPAALTAAALLAGVVVYGLLATAYDEFYAELGLTPSDVGISYGQALGGAAALSVLVVLLMAGLTLAFWWTAIRVADGKLVRRIWVYLVATVGFAVVVALLAGSLAGLVFLAVALFLYAGVHTKVRAAVTPIAVATVCAAGFSFLVLSAAISGYADSVADRIKGGGWVEPPAAGGMVFFSVRAMPATVMAESDTGPDSDLARRINNHRIRFLGQGNSQLVLYDADTHESLLLPATKFRVRVLNCETSRMEHDPRCAQP